MNWYKTSANVNALANLFQQEVIDKPFQSLNPEEKQSVINHINQRQVEVKQQVETITTNPQYQSWIYDMILAKSLIFPEDIDKTKSLLMNYHQVKLSSNFPKEYKDITRFKSFGELHKIVYEFAQKLSKGEKAIELGNNKIIYNQDNIQIVELLNYKDSSYLLNGTGWCIKEERYFDNYNPPYYMFLKDNKKYALLHFSSNQLKDIHDNPLKTLDEEMSKAVKWLFESKNIKIYEKITGDFVILFSLLTPEQKKKYIDLRIPKGYGLTYSQFNSCDNELKRYYIDLRIKKGYGLTDSQFNSCDNEQKKKYIDLRIKKGYDLTDSQFNSCDNEQKKKYIDLRIPKGYGLTYSQFNSCDNELKRYYIDLRIKKGYGLTDSQKQFLENYNKPKMASRLWSSTFNDNIIL